MSQIDQGFRASHKCLEDFPKVGRGERELQKAGEWHQDRNLLRNKSIFLDCKFCFGHKRVVP